LWAKGWLRRGAGIAVRREQGRRVATCAEVRPDGIGQLRVTRIVTAYEGGAVVNPGAVISRIDVTGRLWPAILVRTCVPRSPDT
jgi:CO/xanthine dehydrogenase Mo-binding subunit